MTVARPFYDLVIWSFLLLKRLIEIQVIQMEVTVDQALQQGIAAHKEGKLRDAERLYRAILQAQPSHPDANHNLGVLAVAVDKTLEALPLFKRALDANPRIEQFWLSYIDALVRAERFDDAKQVLIDGEQSGVPTGRLHALKQRLQGGRSKDTHKTQKQQRLSGKKQKFAEKKKSKKKRAQRSSSVSMPQGIKPSQAQLDHLLAQYQSGCFVEAATVAGVMTTDFPSFQLGWTVLGASLKQMGKLSESLAAIQQSTNLSPKDAAAHSNLGITLQEMGRLDEAESSLRRAIALEPDFAEAHNNLGITLIGLERFREAEASLRRAIALKPDYAEANNNLGNALKDSTEVTEAEACYERAILLAPDYAEAHSNLANLYQSLGRLREAEASLRRAIALKPNFAEVTATWV